MKILYCAPEAQNPHHYAYNNIRASFLALGCDLVDFDYLAAMKARGQAQMLAELTELIDATAPDLFYHAIIEDELSVEFLEGLKARPNLTTMVFFSDDDWRLEHSLAWVGHYDLATTNDPNALATYRARGHHHVRHLQYAANPEFFWPRQVEKRYDVTFVGQATPGRPEMVRDLLAAGLDVRVWGSGWERYPELRAIAGGMLPTEIMIETFCASRIVLNFSWCSNWNGHGPYAPQIKGRSFEYPAAGAFQLCLEDPRLATYFEPGVEVATFKDTSDLIAKIRHYLAHEAEREKMAAAALARVQREHTWTARWRAFFADVASQPVPGKPALNLPEVVPAALVFDAPAPKVSVITYVYNIAEYLDALITSVRAQTYQDFEMVILDDGSTDSTPELVARHLADPRVRYFRQENVGKTGRFDLLIASVMRHARGELIAFIGGDDTCAPRRLERQVALFDADPELDVLGTNGHHIDPDGKPMAGSFDLPEPFNAWTMSRQLLHRNLISHPTVMMRRRCWERVGPFEQGFAADYHYWMKSARFLKYRYLDEKLVSYRIHPKSSSMTQEGLVKAAHEAIRLVRAMRPTMTIRDLYPELALCADANLALAAAYSDLGNRFMTEGYRDADLAVAEYQRALEHLPKPDAAVVHNLAWAAYQVGEIDAAKGLMRDVVLMGFDAARKSQALMEQSFKGVAPLASTRHVSPELFEVKPPYGAGVWDHAGAILDAPYRVALIGDWQGDQWNAHLLAFARAFAAGDRVELILPTQGMNAEALGEKVLEVLAQHGVDPDALPDLEIRETDDVEELRAGCEALLDDHDSPPSPEALRAAWLAYVPRPLRAMRPSAEPEAPLPRFTVLTPILSLQDVPMTLAVLRRTRGMLADDAPVDFVVWSPDAALVAAHMQSGDPFVVVGGDERELLRRLVAADCLLCPEPLDEVLAEKAAELDLPMEDSRGLVRRLASWDARAIDIVLLTHNRLAYLARTVDALFERTRHPFRLTIVDNASDPDVQRYLTRNRSRFHRVIRNPDNRWTGAFTQGIDVSRSDPFMVSDPDVVVPELGNECWLTRMLGVMDRHPEMGMLALNLDRSNLPSKLPDVYLGSKEPHGPDIVLSNVGTVFQTISRRFWTGTYTTDWQTVEAIRNRGGQIGFAKNIVGYHLGWDEERDYPEHLLKKYRYFNRIYGSELYKHYTTDPELLAEMGDGTGAAATGEWEYPVTLVMLTLNQLDFTKVCIDSLFAQTRGPFELVVVDNGSRDETPAYLTELASRRANVRIALNDVNRGFAGGCNQGIAMARGREIVLLNNDTVLSAGWLEGLMKIGSRPKVGLVGARSNNVVGLQKVDDIGYDPATLTGYQAFAASWSETHRDKVLDTVRVIGFCVLVKREVLDAIGGLDETFGRGNFEDDDYCLRTRLLGYRVVVADEVFVHHFGSVTFANERVDYNELIAQNWKIFAAKWALPGDRDVKRGYSVQDILSRPYDRMLHSEAVFRQDGERAVLSEPRAFNIVAFARTVEPLAALVTTYLEAFDESADVALHLIAALDSETVQEAVLSAIARAGRSPEHIPDIVLLEAPVSPAEWSPYAAAADLVIADELIARSVRDTGKPAFVAPGAALLREAVAQFAALDWSEPCPELTERPRRRHVVPDPAAWPQALAGYLAQEGLDAQDSLVLVVPMDRAEPLQDEIATWLRAHGHDLETIPDVTLLEADTRSLVARCRVGTSVVADEGSLEAAIAAGLGLPLARWASQPRENPR